MWHTVSLPEFLLIFSFKSLCEIISGAEGVNSHFPAKNNHKLNYKTNDPTIQVKHIIALKLHQHSSYV